MEQIKKRLPEMWVFIGALILFGFKLLETSNFNPDLGRDMMWIWDVLHGNPTLLGPKLSFGGYYLGPYYYYIFAPFVYLFDGFPQGLVIGNMLLFALATAGIFYFLKKNSGVLFAVLSTVWISITPYYLFSSRNPGNAYSYIGLLVLQLFAFLYAKKDARFFAVMGFTSGLVLNFHPAAVFVLAPFFIASLIAVASKVRLKSFLIFCFSASVMYAPVILFELRHGFIMFKNTFIDGSYKAFIGGESPASMMKASANPIINTYIIDRFLSPWIHPSVGVLFLLTIISSYLFKLKKKVQPLVLLIVIVVLFNIALQFQVAFHYAFPLLVAVQVLSIYFIAKIKSVLRYVILILLLIISLFWFPKHAYDAPYRSFEQLYIRSQEASRFIPSDGPINIAYISDNPLATLGYEYRYIFKVLGYVVLDEQEYSQSQRIVIVSERGNLDFDNLKTWELDQFGPKKLIMQKNIDGVIYYLFQRSE